MKKAIPAPARTLFPEWAAAHQAEVYPEIITLRWQLYGKVDGQTCGNCANLVVKRVGHVYFKCALAKQTRGPSTDFRKSWPACGKFEPGPQQQKVEDKP